MAENKRKTSSRWWTSEESEMFNGVFMVANDINKRQVGENISNQWYASLYANEQLSGFGATLFGSAVSSAGLFNESARLSFNVVKNCVDSIASQISKNKPRVEFSTFDADYSLKKKAQNLTKYVDGLFYAANVYEVMQRAFLDALIFGTGCVKVLVENETEIKIERVICGEIAVDNADGAYEKPKQMHQSKRIGRDVLIEMYPEYETEIINCPDADMSDPSGPDQVLVRESWHLPSGPKAKDGIRAITIANATLFVEEYRKNYFPFVFIRWSQRIASFWGQGLVQDIAPKQLQLDRMYKAIIKAQEMCCVPRVFVEDGSLVNPGALLDTPGAIVTYNNNPPQFNTAPAMPAEVYSWFDRLHRSIYEENGINPMSASARAPSGVDSAIAMRTFQDIGSERHALAAQRYERSFLSLAEIMIDMSRDLYEDHKDLKITSPQLGGKRSIEQIKWKDVNLAKDKFMMQMFPVGLLPKTPEGRLQTVTELMKSQIIDRDQAVALLDFPDTSKFFADATADRDEIEAAIEHMLEGKEYIKPYRLMDLQLGAKLAQQAYNRSYMSNRDDHALEALQQFVDDCMDLLNEQAQPAQQQQQAQPEPNPGQAA